MELAGATVVVTGAMAGLGLATAQHFLGRGARVAVFDLKVSRESATDTWLPVTVDIRKADQVDGAFETVARTWDRPSVVVHCAGVAGSFRLLGRDGPVDPTRFRTMVDVNLLGTFHVLRAAAWQMSQRPPSGGAERGVIVTTASIAAFEGQQGQVAYAATKAGVVGMTLPAARELAEYGIRCVTIAPGAFETTLTTDLPTDLQEQLVSAVAYPRRLGRPEEFAALVGAVVGNEMINAGVIRLDAGARLSAR